MCPIRHDRPPSKEGTSVRRITSTNGAARSVLSSALSVGMALGLVVGLGACSEVSSIKEKAQTAVDGARTKLDEAKKTVDDATKTVEDARAAIKNLDPAAAEALNPSGKFSPLARNTTGAAANAYRETARADS